MTAMAEEPRFQVEYFGVPVEDVEEAIPGTVVTYNGVVLSSGTAYEIIDGRASAVGPSTAEMDAYRYRLVEHLSVAFEVPPELLVEGGRLFPTSEVGYDPFISSADCAPLDETPDECWRCDARPSATDLGLCHRCLTVLRSDVA